MAAVYVKAVSLINSMIEEQKIKEAKSIYLFLDEMDITYKDERYDLLCSQHRYDEAFALPNTLTNDAKKLLLHCSRIGVKVVLYTTRVDTKRVDATVKTFSHVLDVGFPVVHSVVCLRNEENQLLPLSKLINECGVEANEVTFGILVCGFQLRIDDFLNNAPLFEAKKAINY